MLDDVIVLYDLMKTNCSQWRYILHHLVLIPHSNERNLRVSSVCYINMFQGRCIRVLRNLGDQFTLPSSNLYHNRPHVAP